MSAKTIKQHIVGLKDLRLNMEKYIQAAGRGEAFTVVRRSRPVFRILPADEWGESGWETVVDFREIDPKGVQAEDVLSAIKKIDG